MRSQLRGKSSGGHSREYERSRAVLLVAELRVSERAVRRPDIDCVFQRAAAVLFRERQGEVDVVQDIYDLVVFLFGVVLLRHQSVYKCLLELSPYAKLRCHSACPGGVVYLPCRYFQSLSDHLLVENTEAVVERAVCDVASAQLCAGLSRQESRADRLLNRVADNFAVLADSGKGVHRHGVSVACVAHDEL